MDKIARTRFSLKFSKLAAINDSLSYYTFDTRLLSDGAYPIG